MAAYLRERWNADEETGSFQCPIPGHGGSATLVDQGGDLRLGCSCEGRWRSLGEVFAAEAYRRDHKLSNIQLATWTRRLAFEAGDFGPALVPVPRLPDTAPPHVVRARDGFVLLVGLRWADWHQRPLPFSITFCAAWCDLPYRAANEALAELRELGAMVQVGLIKRAPLYMLGQGVAA